MENVKDKLIFGGSCFAVCGWVGRGGVEQAISTFFLEDDGQPDLCGGDAQEESGQDMEKSAE